MRLSTLIILTLACLIAPAAGPSISAEGPDRVTPGELMSMLKRGDPVVLIDVCTPREFGAGHIPGSVSMPVDTLESAEGLPRGGRVILYCKAGKRSQRAFEILSARGFTGISVLEGGLDAWKESGGRVAGVPFPPNEGKKTVICHPLSMTVRDPSLSSFPPCGGRLGWGEILLMPSLRASRSNLSF